MMRQMLRTSGRRTPWKRISDFMYRCMSTARSGSPAADSWRRTRAISSSSAVCTVPPSTPEVAHGDQFGPARGDLSDRGLETIRVGGCHGDHRVLAVADLDHLEA